MRSRGRGSSSLGAVGCAVVIVGLFAIGALASWLDQPADAPPTDGALASASIEPESTEPPESSLEPEPTILRVGLREALDDDLVELRARGRNLQQLDIEIESNVEVSLEISIEAGLVFSTSSSGVQPMIVITDTYLQVEPELSVEWSLDVACGSMLEDEPTSADRFKLAAKPAKADVRRLVAVEAFHDADFRVQQFAIWTITDDPPRRGFVGLGSGGAGSGPTAAEIREIRSLFRAAGIELARYRALD